MKNKTLLLNYRNPIDVTITEEDRQKADVYISNYCLIGTVVERLGYPVLGVGSSIIVLKNGNEFHIPREVDHDIRISSFSNIRDNRATPYYDEAIVGLQFILMPIVV